MDRPCACRTQFRVPPARGTAALTHLDTSFLIRSLVSGTSEHTRVASWLKANELIAIRANAVLATSNRADFQRLVPFGVQLADE